MTGEKLLKMTDAIVFFIRYNAHHIMKNNNPIYRMVFMSEFSVLAKSEESILKIVEAAFSSEHVHRRKARLAVRRVLDLADRRGNLKMDDFVNYFSSQSKRNPTFTRKMLRSLFEFVSEDEVIQLSRLHTFDD